MKLFMTNTAFEQAAEQRAREHMSALFDQWSENRVAIRASVAAWENVAVENLREVPTLERCMSRAVKAFAKAIGEQRERAQ
jgi:hypothetical protein